MATAAQRRVQLQSEPLGSKRPSSDNRGTIKPSLSGERRLISDCRLKIAPSNKYRIKGVTDVSLSLFINVLQVLCVFSYKAIKRA